MATAFTVAFALCCLATFVCGARKQWGGARLTFAIAAIVSFLLAMATAGHVL